MAVSLKQQILFALESTPGMTDREITDQVLGPGTGQQVVNQAARALAGTGRVVRRPRPDGKIGNYLSDASPVIQVKSPTEAEIGVQAAWPSEDAVKRPSRAGLRRPAGK